MKRFTYTLVCAAMTAALTAPLASCSNDFDAVESVDEFVGEEIKVCSFPAFTTDGSTRAVDEKTSWTGDDTIYVQLNGKGEWYALSYADSKWSAPKGFSMKKTDTYKAVYAPNYELNSSKDALVLSDGKTASTAEYLTCEGTRPIEINFTRNYSRLRISATASSTISVSFGDGFTANDGSDVKSFSLTTDDSGNAYVYGSWSAETKLDIESVIEGNPSEDVAYAVASSNKTIKSESVNGKAYTTASPTDVWYVYNIDRATTGKKGDWSDVAGKGYSNIKIVGTWDGNNVKIDFAQQENLSKLDLSEVKNLTILPVDFCSGSSFSEVKLPDCLTTISDYAFLYSNIKSIDIPESVTSIGSTVFMDCGLDFIICRAVTPPSTGNSAFRGVYCTLYVPEELFDIYKENTYWGFHFGDVKKLSELNQ